MLKKLVKIKKDYVAQKEQIIKETLLSDYNINNYEIKYTKNGKPYIEGNEVYFSISHDKDLLLIVFDNNPVGADIQFYRPINDNLKDLLMIDSNESKEIINEFSAREAVIKLMGKRLCNINDIHINDYKIKTIKEKDYVINIAHYKQ